MRARAVTRCRVAGLFVVQQTNSHLYADALPNKTSGLFRLWLPWNENWWVENCLRMKTPLTTSLQRRSTGCYCSSSPFRATNLWNMSIVVVFVVVVLCRFTFFISMVCCRCRGCMVKDAPSASSTAPGLLLLIHVLRRWCCASDLNVLDVKSSRTICFLVLFLFSLFLIDTKFCRIRLKGLWVS